MGLRSHRGINFCWHGCSQPGECQAIIICRSSPNQKACAADLLPVALPTSLVGLVHILELHAEVGEARGGSKEGQQGDAHPPAAPQACCSNE